MRFLPSSASSKLLISQLTCAAVDIRLLWRVQSKKIEFIAEKIAGATVARIHESRRDSLHSKTLRGMTLSARRACNLSMQARTMVPGFREG
jgi:hypothetical protein